MNEEFKALGQILFDVYMEYREDYIDIGFEKMIELFASNDSYRYHEESKEYLALSPK